MPKDTFTHSAGAAAPRNRVWKALDSPTTWEGIGGVDRVIDPVIDDQGRLRGFSFETTVGGRAYRGRATPRERIETEKMSWDIDAGEIKGTTAVHLAGGADDTMVTVTLDVESAGILSSLFFPMISSAIGNGLPGAVEDFAKSLADPSLPLDDSADRRSPRERWNG